MYQLQKELAIQEQRFEDARAFQQHIYHEMTHSQLLRLVRVGFCRFLYRFSGFSTLGCIQQWVF